MNSRVILQIPMPKHLMCFIKSELTGYKGQLAISRNSELGSYLMGIIEECDFPPEKNITGSYIECLIPARDQYGKSYDGRNKWLKINEVNLKRFHRIIHKTMMRELYGRLDLLVDRGEAQRKGGKMTSEIEKFIAKYSGNESELSMENIRKDYYRYRKRATNPENTSV
tara:strand:- start:66 stop:569 length:504 start_codon:yes stop_codon:yes gene_type:complete